MYENIDWTIVPVPDFDSLPAPVFLRSEDLSGRQMFPRHAHPWNQFVYAKEGSLVVSVDDSWYVITPEQAIWVPSDMPHTVGTLHGAQFRNLYVADVPKLGMPKECVVFKVSPLLRALIVELNQVAFRLEPGAYVNQINDLVVEQLHRLIPQTFHLPWPRSPMLRTLCEALYADPSDTRDMNTWGRALGASSRTLARHFRDEVGLNLRDWRQRLRLFLAIEWLANGRSVTAVALELGYSSTSAFTYMFRQEVGCSPTEWLSR